MANKTISDNGPISNLYAKDALQILKKRFRFLNQSAEQYKNSKFLHTSKLNGKLFIVHSE
jgi:hypothetical protein